MCPGRVPRSVSPARCSRRRLLCRIPSAIAPSPVPRPPWCATSPVPCPLVVAPCIPSPVQGPVPCAVLTCYGLPTGDITCARGALLAWGPLWGSLPPGFRLLPRSGPGSVLHLPAPLPDMAPAPLRSGDRCLPPVLFPWRWRRTGGLGSGTVSPHHGCCRPPPAARQGAGYPPLRANPIPKHPTEILLQPVLNG